MTNKQEELKQLMDSREGPWHKGEDIIRLAKKLGRPDLPEIIKEYAPLQRGVYESSGIYFNNPGKWNAELKITPDNWQLDGCDSLELSTVQKNYISLLIDEGQKDKAKRLLEQILNCPNTSKFDLEDFKGLYKSL